MEVLNLGENAATWQSKINTNFSGLTPFDGIAPITRPASTVIVADRLVGVYYEPLIQSVNITLSIDLVNSIPYGAARLVIITNGINTIVADGSFVYNSGLTSSVVLIAGLYEIFVINNPDGASITLNAKRYDAQENSAIILLRDDFIGSTINAVNWPTIVDPVDSVSISQGDGLIFSGTAVTLGSVNNNNITSKNLTSSTKTILTFDITRTGSQVAGVLFGLRNTSNNRIDITKDSATSTYFRLLIVVGGATIYDFSTTVVLSTKRVKIIRDNVTREVKFYYFNSGVWTQMGVTTTLDSTQNAAFGTTLNVYGAAGSDSSGISQTKITRLRVTDSDYTTELPYNV